MWQDFFNILRIHFCHLNIPFLCGNAFIYIYIYVRIHKPRLFCSQSRIRPPERILLHMRKIRPQMGRIIQCKCTKYIKKYYEYFQNLLLSTFFENEYILIQNNIVNVFEYMYTENLYSGKCTYKICSRKLYFSRVYMHLKTCTREYKYST